MAAVVHLKVVHLKNCRAVKPDLGLAQENKQGCPGDEDAASVNVPQMDPPSKH